MRQCKKVSLSKPETAAVGSIAEKLLPDFNLFKPPGRYWGRTGTQLTTAGGWIHAATISVEPDPFDSHRLREAFELVRAKVIEAHSLSDAKVGEYSRYEHFTRRGAARAQRRGVPSDDLSHHA